jgi:hypothetical protein
MNKLHFYEMMIMSALYWTNMLRWNFVVLAHWNNSPWVEMSLHSDILFWFQAPTSLCSYSLVLHLGGKAVNTNFSLWFDLRGTLTNNLPHSRQARCTTTTQFICYVIKLILNIKRKSYQGECDRGHIYTCNS